MEAILTQDFFGVPDGEIHPRNHPKGARVHGALAAAALSAGVAKQAAGPNENKMIKGARDDRFQPDMEGRDGGNSGERAKPQRRGRGSRKGGAKRG